MPLANPNDALSKKTSSLRFKCYLFVYSFLMRVLGPVLRIKAVKRGKKEPGYLYAVDERFAKYGDATKESVRRFKPGAIWIHAVSLGETKAALVLVKELLGYLKEQGKERESIRFLFTHSTATGRQAGRELINSLGLDESSAAQVWYPWDTPGGVQRFLDHFCPRIGLLMETEVWPNMVLRAQTAGVPLILVNARMNEKSFKSAHYAGLFARVVYQNLSAVLAQTPADALRLEALGAPVVGTFGNLKFDASVNTDQITNGVRFADYFYKKYKKRIALFASSRPGEEALLLHSLIANRTLSEGVQWLIVPRHPQRFAQVIGLAVQLGFAVSKRTSLSAAAAQSANNVGENIEYFENISNPSELPVRWIGDTVGEMHYYYAASSVALLGGSFEPLGGQNLIEAAACGCPIVMGPHVFNFTHAADQACKRGAAVQAQSLQEACARAYHITLDEQTQSQMSGKALAFAAENKGAVAKTVHALRGYL